MPSEDSRIRIALAAANRLGALQSGVFEVVAGADARDDCAVLRLTAETDLVIGSDFVRGTGFHLFQEGLLSHEDIGWYLVAANVSDIAAMGARPAGLVVAVRYSPELSDDEWEAIHRGIAGACAEFHVPLLGGDSGGYSVNVLSGAAIGTVPRGRALLRSAGQAGDDLYLTGTVGGAGAALAFFRRGRHGGAHVDQETENRMLGAWRRARPALAQGAWLAESGTSRCALDTSDGLKAGLVEIAIRSGLDVVVDPESIPIDPAALAVSRAMRLDPLALAVSDSVDFRLLFSVAPALEARLREEFSKRGWELHRIGQLRAPAGEPRVVSLVEGGGEAPLPGVPWDQSEVLAVDRL